jgi:hypothetical protein
MPWHEWILLYLALGGVVESLLFCIAKNDEPLPFLLLFAVWPGPTAVFVYEEFLWPWWVKLTRKKDDGDRGTPKDSL